MSDIKDMLKALIAEVEDAITEVEDSDEIGDEDVRANAIDSLEEASSSVAEALTNFMD